MAVQLHKTMIDRGLEATLETMLAFETEALVMTAVTDDHAEGANALAMRESRLVAVRRP